MAVAEADSPGEAVGAVFQVWAAILLPRVWGAEAVAEAAGKPLYGAKTWNMTSL